MFFDGWGNVVRTSAPGDHHLFAGGNNINGFDILASEADGVYRDFVTMDSPSLVEVQERYIRRVVDTVGDLDNVLYEICNEAGAPSHDWQDHLIQVVRDYEKSKGFRHPIGSTGGMGTLNERTYASPADWVSPDCEAADGRAEEYRTGGYTWGRAPHDLADKVVLLDTDHLWGIGGDEVFAWKSFCRGYNVLYMDPCRDMPWFFFRSPKWESKTNFALRREMGVIRSFAERMDLNAAVPSNTLCSTGYCLADLGNSYLAYQPSSEPFTLQLESGPFSLQWHDPSTGTTQDPEPGSLGDGVVTLSPPFQGGAVAFLRR
jgi:hypothetical protein